jgi:hypothetical protein
MYSTCLFCQQDLGSNEVIEHFPVGRRLAFDASKGRLWVVCRKCERWNLTPIEERWEAIEECERLFVSTRLRVSTDNIGLAKLREGLELVRIGNALRPEMAAWRYGDQFGRRRRKHILLSGAAIAVIGGILVLGPATGIVAGGGWGSWQLINALHQGYQNRRVRARLRLPSSDEIVPIRKKQLGKVAVVRAEESWALRVPVPAGRGRFYPIVDADDWSNWDSSGDSSRDSWHTWGRRRRSTKEVPGRTVLYTGPEALQAASKLLPAINEKGARSEEVQLAVELIADAGDPSKLFERYATTSVRVKARATAGGEYGHVIDRLPKEVRIALEMASHEEQERRALEGELALLEAAWREAEEIAKIADDMFLPDTTTARLEELKQGG